VERYVDAARRALDAGELGSVLARAERGVACGATGAMLSTLLRLQAEAHRWRGDNADTVRCSAEAARALTAGTAEWYLCVRESSIACGRLGDREALATVAAPLRTPPSPEARVAHASAASWGVLACFETALPHLARELHGALPAVTDADPTEMRGDVLRARAALARADGDLETQLVCLEDAARRFEESGNLREMCSLRVAVGRARQLLGMHQRSLGPLREARAASRRLGLHHVAAVAEVHLAAAHLTEDALDEARGACDRAIEAFTRHGNRRLAGLARVTRCRVATALLDLDRALVEGERAIQLLEPDPADQALAYASAAETHLSLRDAAGAMALSERALTLLGTTEVVCLEDAFVHLVHVDALTLAERFDAARAVVALAHTRLMTRAGRIRTPALRESYLTAIRDHARVATLYGQGGSMVESTQF
jgi:tetratricopeptide (TPR) repeat protein